MDRALKMLLAISVACLVTAMTGCTAPRSTWVSPTGQIMDGTNNPIYPDLAYTSTVKEGNTDANGNPL